ncbi:uncharacterized protein LOC143374481 [Andrena cerasifolii]|uniref:uncharacterized protein LOC143374481 n=1 Tax=Andrena cerasifolii TaxID=2819439 RepID=UPI0040382A84
MRISFGREYKVFVEVSGKKCIRWRPPNVPARGRKIYMCLPYGITKKMLFTLDQETPSTSVSNIDEDPGPSFLEESSEVDANNISTPNLEDAETSIIEKDPAVNETQPDDREEEVPITNYCPDTATRKGGKKRKPEQDASEFYRTCTDALKAPSTSKVDISEFEAIGIKVGKQLQRMETDQAIYAKSIITAVLRRGLFKSLNPHTDLCDNNCNVIAMANSSGSTAGSNSSNIEGSSGN